jgi:hypothetical protein
MGPMTNGDGANDRADRARQGMEHLQAAAKELIAAARAALDVAEDVVDDPDALAALAGLLGSVGEMARRASGAGGGESGPGDDGASSEAETPPARVRRIVVD